MKYQISWNYSVAGDKQIQFISDWIDGDLAIEAGEKLQLSGKAKDLFFIDEMNNEWTLKELKKLTEKIEAGPHELTIYFDGGFNKETYEGGLGAVIYYKIGKKKYRLRSNALIDEMETNNEAEYAALYFALDLLEEINAANLPCEIKGDSQVVLKQLEGEWPCFEEHLNRWLDRIEEKIKKLGLQPKYIPIKRTENKEADQLASQALQGKNIHSKRQII